MPDAGTNYRAADTIIISKPVCDKWARAAREFAAYADDANRVPAGSLIKFGQATHAIFAEYGKAFPRDQCAEIFTIDVLAYPETLPNPALIEGAMLKERIRQSDEFNEVPEVGHTGSLLLSVTTRLNCMLWQTGFYTQGQPLANGAVAAFGNHHPTDISPTCGMEARDTLVANIIHTIVKRRKELGITP